MPLAGVTCFDPEVSSWLTTIVISRNRASLHKNRNCTVHIVIYNVLSISSTDVDHKNLFQRFNREVTGDVPCFLRNYKGRVIEF